MSISQSLKKLVDTKMPGSVFCANDFSDVADRGTIDVNLHRFAKSGVIRRLGFGLYDKPQRSSLLGDLMPDISDVINAYARRTGQTLTLDPASAANTLSLTTQVPGQLTFLTDGKSHTLTICGVDIKLVHASPKKLAGAGHPMGIIIQALRYFGAQSVSDDLLKKMSRTLSAQDVQTLKSLRSKMLQSVAFHIDRMLAHATIH